MFIHFFLHYTFFHSLHSSFLDCLLCAKHREGSQYRNSPLLRESKTTLGTELSQHRVSILCICPCSIFLVLRLLATIRLPHSTVHLATAPRNAMGTLQGIREHMIWPLLWKVLQKGAQWTQGGLRECYTEAEMCKWTDGRHSP